MNTNGRFLASRVNAREHWYERAGRFAQAATDIDALLALVENEEHTPRLAESMRLGAEVLRAQSAECSQRGLTIHTQCLRVERGQVCAHCGIEKRADARCECPGARTERGAS